MVCVRPSYHIFTQYLDWKNQQKVFLVIYYIYIFLFHYFYVLLIDLLVIISAEVIFFIMVYKTHISHPH